MFAIRPHRYVCLCNIILEKQVETQQACTIVPKLGFQVILVKVFNKNRNNIVLGTQKHDFALKNKLFQEASASYRLLLSYNSML